MNFRFFLFLSALILAASCKHTKDISKDDKDLTVNLDTVEITVSRENPYRGSADKNFDLIHTKLEVKFDYAAKHLTGKATITLKPHFYPQNELVLDAKQFDIREVSIMQNENLREKLNFDYDSLQLRIPLGKKYTGNDTLKIFVDYSAKPDERKSRGSAAITDDKGLYFINADGKDSTKPIQIWTQGETESNSCWFPTIDKPNQKMTNEIYITHEKKYVSLSNGTLVSTKENTDSTVTDFWKMDLPHAPYLVMMAVGDFAITRDSWRDMEVNYYTEKKYAPYAKQIFGNTPQMIEFFSQKLGFDYPWQKYSQVVVRDYVSGAMENTSATLHGEFIQRNSRELLDETYEDVISHELFHQWFGDLITCESWSNIPLNESFATYGEYLWNEYKYGKEYADYKQWENYEKFMEESETKNVDLIRFHYNNREDMFDRHSYEKGGILLHYLRNIIGDDAFFQSLELYLKTNQFKSAEIHNLRLAFEQVTGKDLNVFFNQWFFNSGYPKLKIDYGYTNDSVYVSIEQTQNTGKGLIYTLPMRIDVWYGANAESHDVVLKKKSQQFVFKANGKPDLIDADALRIVLCGKEENKVTEQYAFQYRHSKNFAAKYEALVNLSEAQKNDSLANAVVASALNDEFFYIRQYAAEQVLIPKHNNEEIYSALRNLMLNDKSSRVRTAAIEKLSDSEKKDEYTAEYEKQTGDSSYEVAATALVALKTADEKKALQIAKIFENEKNTDIANAVADVYARVGDADYQNYFENKLLTSSGINKYYLFYYYANFITRMDKSVAGRGIKTIENEGLATDSHWYIGAAKGSLKRISKSFEEKKKNAQEELSREEGQTAKLELQEKIGNYDYIIAAAKDALERVNQKTAEKKKDN